MSILTYWEGTLVVSNEELTVEGKANVAATNLAHLPTLVVHRLGLQ
jgi:hypothetical protein